MFSETIQKFPNIKHFRRSDVFFVLNTKFIAISLLAVCIVLISDEFFRTSIDCHINNSDKTHFKQTLDNYCWAHGTFICLNNQYGQNGCSDKMEEVHQNYYQWLIFALFAQSLFAYVPSVLWKMCERDFFEQLCEGLDDPLNKEASDKKQQDIVNYILNKHAVVANLKYLQIYIGCVVLAVISSTVNIFILHLLLGDQLAKAFHAQFYLLQGEGAQWSNQMNEVFPLRTMCTTDVMGEKNQTYSTHECLLPLNVLNQKLFIFIFFILGLQLISSVLNFILMLLFSFRCSRVCVIRYLYLFEKVDLKLLKNDIVCKSASNFLLFYIMAQNSNLVTFIEILEKIENKTSTNNESSQNILEENPDIPVVILNSS